MHVYIGPGCSYSFLHLTLQEYLTALHIAIVNPCDIELIEWLREGSVVVRFLAGICRHDDYHSHPVYQVLLQLLAYKYRDLMLVRCAYEHPSIMDSMKVFYKNEYDIINVQRDCNGDCTCLKRFTCLVVHNLYILTKYHYLEVI